MSDKSYREQVMELSLHDLRDALMDMSVAASTPVFRAMSDGKKDFEVADAVAEGVRKRVSAIYRRSRT